MDFEGLMKAIFDKEVFTSYAADIETDFLPTETNPGWEYIRSKELSSKKRKKGR